MEFHDPKGFINLDKLGHRNINFNNESEELLKVIDSANNESDVQHYIKQNKKWFVPGSLFLNYNFGHHEAYIVPEQQLGAEYRVDYMLVGLNSICYRA